MITINDFKRKQLLFVFLDYGELISFKNDNIVIKTKENKIKHQSTCYLLFALFVCGHTCLTSGLLERAEKFGFTIVLMNHNMRPYAILPARAEGNILLRRSQYQYESLEIAHYLVANKIRSQRETLKKIRNKTPSQKTAVKQLALYEEALKNEAFTLNELMGIEGTAARLYFEELFLNHQWKGRRPRAKSDMVNCLMDIGYTLLFNVVNAFLEMYGFDVYLGVLHTAFFHRKSLVCDLMEPFRPIIDSEILKMLNWGQCREKDFSIQGNQYFLFGKNAAPYISSMSNAIIAYKEPLYRYIQQYYRAFIRNKSIEDFPIFKIEEV